MAIEIKQVNGLQAALDGKADTGDVPETGAEGLVLTASQTSITPSGKPTIYLYRAPASLPGDVTFLARYNTGIDADFAAGTATGTIAVGSPTVSGGYLDLLGGSASAVSYARQNNFPDHGTFDTFTIRAIVKMPASLPADGVYPIVDLPNYTATCSTDPSNRNRRQLVLTVAGGLTYFQLRLWSVTNTLAVNASWQFTFSANQEYEIEGSSQQDPDNHRLFVDGDLKVTNTNNPSSNNVYDGNNDIFYVGGQGGSTSCEGASGSASDFQVNGVAIFDTIQHTTSYTPTGLPGAGATVENIDTIVTTNYADGEEITIFTPEFEGYTFETGGNLLLASSFDPTLEKGFLKLQRNGADWVETQRSAGGAVNPVDPTESTTTYTCTASESVGDLVYISAADTVARADASAIGTSRVLGHIVEKPTTTTCKVSLSPGPLTASGLTVGSPVYLSDSTPGAVSATEGTIIVEVGIADTTTSFVFTGYKIVG